ncbi:MAG: hypothetical protein ACI4KF_07110 [Huintestinicola sp.]
MRITAELLADATAAQKKHYEYNKQLLKPKSIINGQKIGPIAEFKFGLAKMGYNGCGPIAVYNALSLSGIKADICDIILALEKQALKLGGILGTDPKKLDKFFSDNRIAALKASDYNDFVNDMNNMHVGILCYWTKKPNRSSMHYITIYRTEDNKFVMCNRFGNRNKQYSADSMEKVCTEEQYICGYFIS